MNEPMCRYMKTGIVHFMAFPETIKGEGPILETVYKIATDDYFSAIELTSIKDASIRAKVRDMLHTAHMKVAFGAQPLLLLSGQNINDLSEDGRQKAVDTLKKGIDEAYELGAVGFGFLSGKYEESTKEESYKALVRSTKELCAYARSLGEMKIAHEVFDYDIDKKSLVGPVSLARRYASEVCEEYDNFGLMVDLSHLPLLRESVEEAILPVKEYIIHAHIGNCVVKNSSLPGYGDLHPRFGFPDGENDADEVKEYIKALLDIGYLDPQAPPILSFEVKPFGSEDPMVVIANAKRTLNEAWAAL